MNNWRIIGYIFLGWGSVFLGYAIIVILSMLFSGLPILNQASIAFVLNAPWLILSALMYVIGFVGYFAGRENVATPTNLPKAEKCKSGKNSSEWALAVGALTTLAVIALQYFSGIMANPDRTFGFILPIFISIVAGLIVGLATYVIIVKLD